jgi:hypothetical protein
MKFSEATAHAVSLLNILEESGATASDMLMVSNIFSSLAKASQSSELQTEIQTRMKGAMDKKRDEIMKDVAKVADALVNAMNKRKSGTRPLNIDDLKVPKGKMN